MVLPLNFHKENGSSIVARRKALDSLFQYHKIKTEKVTDEQLLSGNIILTDGHQIQYTSDYSNRNTLFSYVYKHKLSEKQRQKLTTTTSLRKCEFNQCSPRWLCDNDTSTVIGVSNLSSKPSKQFELSQKVASDIFNRTNKSGVQYKARLYTSHKKGTSGTNAIRDFSSITTLSDKQLLLKPQTFVGATISSILNFKPVRLSAAKSS